MVLTIAGRGMTGDTVMIAWAAGLFEGEGSAHVGHHYNSRPYARVSIQMTDREPLDGFLAVVGSGNVTGPYTSEHRQSANGAARKPAWLWSTSGWANTAAIYRAFKPYLSPRRQQQFEDTLVRCPLPKPVTPTCKSPGYSGEHMHRKRGERLCPECLAFQAKKAREYRARTGRPSVTNNTERKWSSLLRASVQA